MKGYIKFFSRVSIFNLVVIIIALSLGLGDSLGKQTNKGQSPHAMDSNCPYPTLYQAGTCTLSEDITPLTSPLVLPSGTILDCKGKTLRPSKFGVINGDRSVPEVGIILHQVSGVTIENCFLDRFDTGIFVVNNKIEDGHGDHKILSNIIHARHFSVEIGKTDNTEVADNYLSISSAGGSIVQVHLNSDFNKIKNNEIVGNFSAIRDKSPGIAGSNQPLQFDSGSLPLFIAKFTGNIDQTLLNSVIDGVLYQIAVDPSDETEGNLVEGNTITNLNGDETDIFSGLEGSATVGTQFLENIINGPVENGVFLNTRGIVPGILSPGKCSLDPTRYCIGVGDCNISGFDSFSKGACIGAVPHRVEEFGRENIIKDNVIHGPFADSGINLELGPLNTIVEGNSVYGPSGVAGITVDGKALETSIIKKNIFSGQSTAILLINQQFAEIPPADFFGAQVTQNDFIGYEIAVLTAQNLSESRKPAGNYSLVSELSFNTHGNYWDLSCDVGGFDPTKVFSVADGLVDDDVVDSHPYGQPVADLSESELLDVDTCQ